MYTSYTFHLCYKSTTGTAFCCPNCTIPKKYFSANRVSMDIWWSPVDSGGVRTEGRTRNNWNTIFVWVSLIISQLEYTILTTIEFELQLELLIGYIISVNIYIIYMFSGCVCMRVCVRIVGAIRGVKELKEEDLVWESSA